jgi:hypothetical protein
VINRALRAAPNGENSLTKSQNVREHSSAVCASNGWQLDQARFYTGIPDASDDPFWKHLQGGKLRNLSRQGVEVFSRSLRYRNKTVMS